MIEAIPHRQGIGLLRAIQLGGGFKGLTQQSRGREWHIPWHRNAIAQIAQPGGTPRWRWAGCVANQPGEGTAQGLVKGGTHGVHVAQTLLVTQHPAQGDDGLIGLMVRIPAGFVLAEAITSVDPFGQALCFRSIVCLLYTSPSPRDS